MKKINQILILCAVILLTTACGAKKEDITSEKDAKETETTEESTSEAKPNEELEQTLKDLNKDEYDGLEIAATVLERKAILPGETIPITVTIINNGDKTVAYAMGSGSFETPQALILDLPGLQPILARDHLGVATLDMRNNELQPGEMIEHTMYVRAIEPNENFNDYTYNRWMDKEEYIGDIEWKDLQAEHDDLKEAPTGSYEGTIYFLYYINEGEQVNPTLSATGYSSHTFKISLTD